RGGGGNDVVADSLFENCVAGGTNATYGEAGADTVLGGPNFDVLFGGDDNDILNGLGGGDWVLGEAGLDTIFANDGLIDFLSCGTNPAGSRDVAIVDFEFFSFLPLDNVNVDCEDVRPS
ncbi:MAG: hypothetical protein WBC51_00825, partial [Vicinamibacterales bacterium]